MEYHANVSFYVKNIRETESLQHIMAGCNTSMMTSLQKQEWDTFLNHFTRNNILGIFLGPLNAFHPQVIWQTRKE